MTPDKARYDTIALFLGHNAMTSTRWGPMLGKLAKQGLISFFCIDKAHEVEQSGQHSRPEFKKAVSVIPQLGKLMPRLCPHILLSVTLLPTDIDVCPNLLGDMRPNILHGPLDHWNIKFTTHITGDSASSLKASAANDFIESPNHQQIWYTHSRTKAEGSLSNMAK